MARGTVKYAIELALVMSACGSSDGASSDSADSTASAVSEPEPSVPAPDATEVAVTAVLQETTVPPETTTPETTVLAAVAIEAGPQPPEGPAAPTVDELGAFAWTTATPDAPWKARAGLRVVDLDGRLILLGGRTPNQSTMPGDSTIWADVWASDDGGATWFDLLEGGTAQWPARAYFQALVKTA